MNRTELNNAIYLVLITQYKKNAPEAFKMVEDAGYKITKYDGCFWVENVATRRQLYVNDRGYVRDLKKNKISHKFDFVGFLNKPLNTEYYRTPAGECERTAKRCRLSGAKFSVWRCERDIEKAKATIFSAENDLIKAVKEREKYMNGLREIRKQLGLKDKGDRAYV